MPQLSRKTQAASPQVLEDEAKSANLRWLRKPQRGLLEYSNSRFLIGLLFTVLGWSVVALLPVLIGNPGITRLSCLRSAPQVGVCQLEKIYLHPFMLPFNSREEMPLSDLVGPQVNELVGDESDSYQLVLNRRSGDLPVFTAMLESTADNAAEDILFFLRQPQEEQVQVKYFDALFFWIMYLPLYLMLLYLVLALFFKLTGKPFNCYWTVLDGETRQLVVIHNNILGWSFSQKHALGAVSAFETVEKEGENHDTFRFLVKLKSGKTVFLTPAMRVKETPQFEAMQDWLLEQLCNTLAEFQRGT
jgi:hypothetical protein